jgi:hypothetical protein
VVAPSELVKRAGVVPWEHLPFWIEPEIEGLMQMSVGRALGTGLRTRPLVDTVRDTYAWLQASDHPRAIEFPPELEERALAMMRA